jgi:hypothetical protein
VAIALSNCGWSAHGLSDDALAEASFREVISLAGRLSSVPLIADGALGLGVVLVAGHEAERGTQLLAAAAALRDELESAFHDDSDEREHEAAIAAARAALGEEAVTAAWARGEAMAPEEIVAFAEKNQ